MLKVSGMTRYFGKEDCETLIITSGVVTRAARSAAQEANASGGKVGVLQLQTLWPFADVEVREAARKAKRIVVAEMNYSGQLAGEVKKYVPDPSLVVGVNSYNGSIMAQEGSFRRDLFFRLNILPLQIPPLRKRKEDIPTLIAHFIKKNHQHVAGRSRLKFDDATLSALSAHGWPGNVRELEHILERVFTLYDEQQDFDALITDIMRRHCLRQGMRPFEIKCANYLMINCSPSCDRMLFRQCSGTGMLFRFLTS